MSEGFSWFAPKYRKDPNAMVQSLYRGVSRSGQIETRIVKPDADGNHLEVTRTYESGLPRGQGGIIGNLILGGMVTTQAEMEDILAEKQEKKWVPKNTNSQIVKNIRELQAARNDRIEHLRKHPSEAPAVKKKNVLFLPVGVKWANTQIPGFQIATKG